MLWKRNRESRSILYGFGRLTIYFKLRPRLSAGVEEETSGCAAVGGRCAFYYAAIRTHISILILI